jgi:CpeT protein
MADKQKNINREEIEAYLSKKMSAAEMHAFEKRVLDSTFDSDAIEGLDELDAATFNKDLADLDQKLKTKKSANINKWAMRIAASILLLVFASVAVYVLSIRTAGTNEVISMLEEITESESEDVAVADEQANVEQNIEAEDSQSLAQENVQSIIKEQIPTTSKVESEHIAMADRETAIAQEKYTIANKDLAAVKRTMPPVSGAALADNESLRNAAKIYDSTLHKLASYLSGSFSSAAQAEADSNFFHIQLHVARIWSNRANGIWLYVEQAAANSLSKPYRQRIYHLYKEGNFYISAIYTIKNPEEVIGAFKQPHLFDKLSMDNVELKSGCEVYLTYFGNRFEGQTGENTCPSDLRGASYTTSKVWLSENEMRSWDQGFNEKGLQVWGSTAGPYIFKRIQP